MPLLHDHHPPVYSSSEPASEWQNAGDQEVSDSTTTSTATGGAIVNVIFEGIAVEVAGSVSQASVSKDASTYTGGSPADRTQSRVLFYAASNLTPRTHRLVTRNAVADGQRTANNPQASRPQKKAIHPGAIVGAVLGPLALISIGILAIFYFKRKRQVNRLTIRPRIGRRVRASSPDAIEKRLPTNATWSVVTPFDITPQSDAAVHLQAEQPLLRNHSSEFVALASTLDLSQSPSMRSSSPVVPPLTPPTSTSRPLPTPPERIELNRLPPPQYVGSGLDPVRKSPLPPSYAAPGTSTHRPDLSEPLISAPH